MFYDGVLGVILELIKQTTYVLRISLLRGSTLWFVFSGPVTYIFVHVVEVYCHNVRMYSVSNNDVH